MDHTGTRRHGSSGTTNKTKRPTFQLKARLLADSCIGYIVNTFARLWGTRDWGVESQVIKFEQVCSAHMRKPLVDRLTDMTENITFPHYVASDNNRNNCSYSTTVTLFFCNLLWFCCRPTGTLSCDSIIYYLGYGSMLPLEPLIPRDTCLLHQLLKIKICFFIANLLFFDALFLFRK